MSSCLRKFRLSTAAPLAQGIGPVPTRVVGWSGRAFRHLLWTDEVIKGTDHHPDIDRAVFLTLD